MIDYEREFKKRNHKIIMDFMNYTDFDNDISASIQATIAQFLLNVRVELNERAKGNNCVSANDIIQAQIMEMRRCIVDLVKCVERINEGVLIQ